jgi:hypothetical protein
MKEDSFLLENSFFNEEKQARAAVALARPNCATALRNIPVKKTSFFL